MELGEKLRQARQERGLSQRQLCGELITRNMLSQIENGSARPSMDTLCVLAERLGKPVGYFLEEGNGNFSVIQQARIACDEEKWEELLRILEEYRQPDSLFDPEYGLLRIFALLGRAEAEAALRPAYAEALLNEVEQLENSTPYYTREVDRRRKLLLAEVSPETVAIPEEDSVLLRYARSALTRGDPERCEAWLTVCRDRESLSWHRVKAALAWERKDYGQAARHYHRLEESCPEEAFSRLEQCYRALENYQLAYTYACKQRELEKKA